MMTKPDRLLAICTTFRRPKMLPDMLKSFYETRSPGTEILVYLHDDDPTLAEYRAYLEEHKKLYGFDLNHVIGRHRCMRELINHVVFNMHREVPYYQIICDDHLYLTPQWDKKLIRAYEDCSGGWGWCCGDDMLNANWHTWAHPSAEIWSWKFVNALGYVYPRSLKHRGLDLYTKDIGAALENGVVFVPEVKIKHLFGADSNPSDPNLKETYSGSNYDDAIKGFHLWQNTDKVQAVGRVKLAKEAERANRIAV